MDNIALFLPKLGLNWN